MMQNADRILTREKIDYVRLQRYVLRHPKDARAQLHLADKMEDVSYFTNLNPN